MKSVTSPSYHSQERNADLRTYFILDSTCLDSVEVGQRQPKIPGPWQQSALENSSDTLEAFKQDQTVNRDPQEGDIGGLGWLGKTDFSFLSSCC